ncbi:MAG: SDR family oxidoreductase [Deltaproteobacteria bacterium]|nr:SDR family oxidoreductase [Deltaproteobacteria bacterium]
MKTIAITGAASGIGAATRARLEREGHRVIGIDVQQADVVADLATREGRRAAIDQILEQSGGRLDGLIPCAGLSGLPGRAGSLLASLNYFGSIELLEGLRGALAASTSGEAAAVGMCSNSTTTAPGVSLELVEACLEGDEEKARAIGDEIGSIRAYPSTKTALARWIRRHAPSDEWIGQGITLNAIAPGKTETPMVAEGRADPILGPHMDAFPVPIGREAQPEEMASLLCFLLGPEARFFVGSVIFCDGGTDALTRPDDWPAPFVPPS